MYQKPGDPLFLEEVKGVKPLAQDKRITRKPPRPGPAEEVRRAAAEQRLDDPNPLTVPDHITRIGPHDIVGRKKNGVQEGVYRKLRLGKYDIQARLDLHRITVSDARERLYEFLVDAHQLGLRTLLITHGKGKHSAEPARIKSHVIHWLEESELVLAYHSAPQRHGGTGCTYVLIRKSVEQRQKTRDQFRQT